MEIILFFGMGVISIIVILKVVSTAVSLIFGAPSVDSSTRLIKKALKLAKLKKGEKIYDIGSSNGQVLKIASRDFSTKAIGLEIAPFPYLISRINCLGQKNIIIKFKNMFKEDLNDADVIYCYLLPGLMQKLSQKFDRELKPGVRVVSNGFLLPDKKPLKMIQVGRNKLYLYIH